MNLRSKFFILITIGVFLIGQWGCATSRYEYSKPEPLLETYRAQLGTIGVVSVPGVPDIHFDRPLLMSPPGVLERIGRGTWEGGEKSARWWSDNVLGNEFLNAVASGLIAIPPLAIAVALTVFIPIIPVTIFGGLGGGIGGAFTPASEPPSNVEEVELVLRDALGEYPIQETFQNSFLKEARARTSRTFVVVPEEGTQTAEGMVGQGMDTVLEFSVQRIWLKRVDDREGEMNPPMVLVLFVKTRLVRGPEKTLWYDQTFVHETKKRPYKEWPYYYRFQEDIEKAYQKLAEQLVHELFFNTQTSPQS